MAFLDSTVSETTSTSITATRPTGAGAGDTLVAFVLRAFINGGDMTASSGWEVQDVLDHPGFNSQLGVFVAPGDVTDLVFTAPSGAGLWTAHVLAFEGRNTTTLAEDWDLGTTTGPSANVGSMVATSGADAAVCWIDCQYIDSLETVPSGYTDTETTNTGSRHMISAYKENLSAGATGSIDRVCRNFSAKFMAGVLMGVAAGGGGTSVAYIIRL